MADVMDLIEEYLGPAQAVKVAAGPGDEGTEHPSKSEEDTTKSAVEGSRSSENSSDVKSQVALSVDATEVEANEGGEGRGQNTPVLSIGTEAAATGEDSSTETASAQPSSARDDPGTSHPAKADMGEKYASLLQMGNDIQASIAVSAQRLKQAGTGAKGVRDGSGPFAGSAQAEQGVGKRQAAGEECPVDPKKKGKPVDEAVKKAEVAGAQAAEALHGASGEALPSRDEVVISMLKQASTDADAVCDFLEGMGTTEKKAGAMPAEAAMMPPPEGAAMPPMGAPPAMPPEAAPAMPGMPPEGGAPGGAPGGEIDPNALIQMLAEAGITPEQLMELLGGGGGGGAPAPAAPPMAPPPEIPQLAPEVPAEAPPALPPTEGEEGGSGETPSEGEPTSSEDDPEKDKERAEKEAALRSTLQDLITRIPNRHVVR